MPNGKIIEVTDDDLLPPLNLFPQKHMKPRFFTNTTKGSNKFWNITLDGFKYTVTFGKIGTAGQTQTKTFPTQGIAKEEYEAIIEEKLKKGYKEKSEGKKYTVTLVTRIVDNQDGGFTAYAYNNEEELLADHYEMEDLKPGSKEWKKKAKEILDGENEYENGYIGSDSFEIEIIDGVARLVGNLSFHGGQ